MAINFGMRHPSLYARGMNMDPTMFVNELISDPGSPVYIDPYPTASFPSIGFFYHLKPEFIRLGVNDRRKNIRITAVGEKKCLYIVSDGSDASKEFSIEITQLMREYNG